MCKIQGTCQQEQSQTSSLQVEKPKRTRFNIEAYLLLTSLAFLQLRVPLNKVVLTASLL